MLLGTFWILGMDHTPATKESTALKFTVSGFCLSSHHGNMGLPLASPSGAGRSDPVLLSFPMCMLVFNDLVKVSAQELCVKGLSEPREKSVPLLEQVRGCWGRRPGRFPSCSLSPALGLKAFATQSEAWLGVCPSSQPFWHRPLYLFTVTCHPQHLPTLSPQ